MDLGATVAPTANPKRMAFSAAAPLNTGKVPGKAISTALAWVLGAAPKRVLLAEKIFDCVDSWAWISSPRTISHSIILIPVYVGANRCVIGSAQPAPAIGLR